MIRTELRTTFDAQRTRRSLLKMGAIALPSVALSLAATAGAIAGNNQGGNNNNQGGNNNNNDRNNNNGGNRAAPAPAIGSGIPAMLAVGAVLFGMKFLKRPRQS